MPDIILEQLEKVVAHNSNELHDKQSAIETYKLIKSKLTPMKSGAFWAEGRIFYICPSCGTIIYTNNNHCSNCGQAIERGED